MMKPERYLGWPLKRVLMPDGDQIICLSSRGKVPKLSTHDMNNNVFRLNAKGEVVWQVRRVDPPEILARYEGLGPNDTFPADAEGRAIIPFTYMDVMTPEGKIAYLDPATGNTPEIQVWKEGHAIHLFGSAYRTWELNPDTGEAKCITLGTVRPW